MGTPVRIYFVALFAVIVFMTYSTLPGVREQPGLVPLYDDYVQSTGYVLAAGGVLWYVLTHQQRRLLWWLVTIALLMRAAGFLHTFFVLGRAPVYPSLADALWITSSVALIAAVVVVAREHVTYRSQLLALDALIGGLAAAAGAWLFLRDTILATAPSGASLDVVATNLTYPLLDVVLFVMVAAILGQSQGRLSLSIGLLSLGILLFAVVDAVFLYQVTEGVFRPGSVLTPLSMLGTAVIALSAWLSPSLPERAKAPTAAGLATPVGLALLCVAVLTYDAVVEVPATSVLLASLGVVVAIVRGFLTFTGDREDTRVIIAGKDEELERFRSLVDASSDFIAMGTMQGDILFINPAGRRLIGFPEDAPLDALRITDTVPEGMLHQVSVVERAHIMEHGSWVSESRLRHLDGGNDVPVMKNTFLVRHPETAQPWLLATIQRDISELRAARSDLQSFQSLVDASSDFIALAELDGTVVYLNPAGRALVGMEDAVDVRSTTIADFLTEEGLAASLEIEQPAVIAEGRWQGESTLRHMRGGPPIPVTINSFLIRRPESGEPWLLATVQRDITALSAARTSLQRLADVRQELLDHLIEAQEAERARIAADVHDDSVQALAALDLQLGLLHRRIHGTSPEADETLAMVREGVTRATDRLRHLLFDLDSPAQRHDLVTVLEDAAAYLFEGQVRWRVEAERDVDLPEAQRVLAHRMAKEAMVNIVKHAHAENVLIRVRRLAVGVEVAITDDGVGMPAGELEQQPGHRGLPDMRDRALIAGGWIRVERGRPRGTTIRIWMPLSATTA